MQSASVSAALPSSSCHYSYPVPNRFLHFRNLHLKKTLNSLSLSRNQIHAKNFCSLTLPTANSFSKEQEENLRKDNKLHPDQNHTFLDQFYSSADTNKLRNQDPESQNQEQDEEPRYNKDKYWTVLCTNMWWSQLKAALGQRINVEGIVSSTVVFAKDRHLALPHVTVPDIRYIDWAELQRRGFKGLYEYDNDASKARKLEGKIGIKVIRHRVKKPAGTAEEIEKHFGCQSSQLIMVGDRPFTDIVYGNRNGFLTILTEPLSLAEEPFIVRQVRKLEVTIVNCWFRRGLKPISHNLLPDAMQCVKDPPSLESNFIACNRS
ncbi:phosphatidylglycerophosphate phosphatase 1, chloroplastic/mitochondrial isoform X2 [Citrus sinensis]|uniref:phosphatidylglycerophosphate phosphatase 1, chloroplastic/mitochondrial isoform X2 n=1 Tax=Citrus sinensis TaxID=2711 RepID=UPI000D62FEF0|nr:phosphatidylglycerophosphate phosphatase 1, chloroplastic/mitochondrial isoform X2 [Citrus sinensis]